MDILFTYPSDLLIDAVGWALLHSLWQGTFIAVLLAVVLRAFPGPGASSRTRYAMSCAALVVVASMFVLTCVHYVGIDQTYRGQSMETGNPAPIVDLVPIGDAPPLSIQSLAGVDQAAGPLGLVEHYLPLMVLAWLLGMVIVSLRLLTGWGLLRLMCSRGISPISPMLQGRVSVLCTTMKVRPVVRVLESSRAVTPMVVGWVRPIILLPAASLTGLSSQQLEAVIAHELAHVLRHDYLVNLLQCVVETLLFYHPAVWWIGRVIRQERERCCDDLAVQVSGDRADYARSLLVLAEFAASCPSKLAPAARGGDLSSRVCRLLGAETQSPAERGSAGLWVVLASFCLLAIITVAVQADSEDVLNSEKINAVPVEAVTNPKDTDTDSETRQRIIEIPYQKLIDGDESYNVVIRPGDIVRFKGPDYVYVQGEINRPGAYSLPGHNDLTLKQLIASAGGVKKDEGVDLYARVFRRSSPIKEKVLYFSVSDLFSGQSRDAFLAPNDLVTITTEPGPEDDSQPIETLEGSGLLPIIPAPKPSIVGEAPLPEDLVPHPFPNTSRPGSVIRISISHSDGSATFVQALNAKGRLSLPGIGEFSFMGLSIEQIKAEMLDSLRENQDYGSINEVGISLTTADWGFTPILPPVTGGGDGHIYLIPEPDFRLRDAITLMRGVPPDTRTILIYRNIKAIPSPLQPTSP